MLEFPDYRSHPAYRFRHSVFSSTAETMKFLPALLRSAVLHLKGSPFRPDYRRGVRNSEAASGFYRNGCLTFGLSEDAANDLYARVRGILEPWRDEHRAIPAACRTMWNALRNIDEAEHKQVYDSVCEHLPTPVSELLRAALGNARPSQIQLSNFFADDEPLFKLGANTLTKYAPWHVDPVINTLKIITYLTPVGEAQGPFHYLRGSHRFNDSVLDRIVIHAHRFTGSGRPGWTWFNDEEGRRRFAALPAFLQKKNTLGADFIDGWELLDSRHDNIEVLTGPPGTAALFDPLGIHCGGKLLEGERVALISIFTPGKH